MQPDIFVYLGRTAGAGVEHNVSRRLDKLAAIGASDDGSLLHLWVLQQHALHFHRAYPHPFDLHHVLRAAYIPIVAVLIAIVLVPGAKPVSLDGVLTLFVLVPVGGANRIAFDQKTANLTVGDGLAIFIDDHGFIA